MEIIIDIQSPEPVYEQIVRQIQSAACSGHITVGTALPSIRQLAHDLDLNHNTVAKAYKVLEAKRVIQTAGRRGTFIHQDAANNIQTANSQYAKQEINELLSTLLDKGLSINEIRSAFENALTAVKKNPKR